MSTPLIASTALLAAGAAIGSISFIAGFRQLPRWIRIAQCLVGLTFLAAGALGLALYRPGASITYRLHQLLFYHVVLLVGMGLGILLLLALSGEYFKALHALDAARRERLAENARRNTRETSN